MARIPGAPRGNSYTAKDLRHKKYTCGCFPGQSVTIQRGLTGGRTPDRVTVVGEYDNIIVLRLEFDQRDEWEGTISTSSWNFTVSKASMLCGEALIKDVTGRTIRPREVEEEDTRGRRGDRRQDRPQTRTSRSQQDDSPRRRPGDRGGAARAGYEGDSLI